MGQNNFCNQKWFYTLVALTGLFEKWFFSGSWMGHCIFLGQILSKRKHVLVQSWILLDLMIDQQVDVNCLFLDFFSYGQGYVQEIMEG